MISRSFETYVTVSLCFQVTLGLSLPIVPNAVAAVVKYGELTAAIPFALRAEMGVAVMMWNNS